MALIVWYWQINLRAREHAIRQCRLICNDMKLQLLDQTVALASMAIQLEKRYQIRLVRKYRFEISQDGFNRYQGCMKLHGLKLQYAEFNLPDGTVIMDRDNRQVH